MPENTSLPETIGRYEVKRLLGSGAMGSVYLAEDPRIKRKLAIKIVNLDTIRNEAERKEFLARFQREAEVSGVLNHPGIVTIYDVGDSELGPFMAMEYVAGQPLDHLVKSGESLSLKSKLQIAAKIAEALDHAHCHGIVHRDVKPGNVMISEDGRPKLMDFGIAKREDAHLTQTGTFLGTPSYASPEQIKEGHATDRSDVFSFGVMIFELLSGSLPFPGSSINTILYRIVNEPPVEIKPAVAGLLPDVWTRVFNKVLAKDPTNRYLTCTAFVRDLVEAATDIDQNEQLELLGAMRMANAAPGTAAPPVLMRAHDETMFVPSTTTSKRAHHHTTVWIGAALAAGISVGAYFLFIRKSGGDMVQLASVPSEARVLVDGKEVGKTPYSLTMKVGQKVVIEHKGYFAKDFEYKADTITPKVELEPIISEEIISSNPDGATIVLDDEKLDGVTPFIMKKWNQGKPHKLTLTKGNLVAPVDFSIGERPNQIYQLREGNAPATTATVGIDPNAPGTIKVTGDYSIRLTVDGKDMGDFKAGAKLSLKPGLHKVELSNTKVFFKDTRTLNIAPGQPHSINLPDLSSLTVETFPSSGLVTVDGMLTSVESDGTTPISMVKGRHVIGIQGKSARETVDLNESRQVRFKVY